MARDRTNDIDRPIQVVTWTKGAPIRRVPIALARRFVQICTAVVAETLDDDDLSPQQYAVIAYVGDEPDMEPGRDRGADRDRPQHDKHPGGGARTPRPPEADGQRCRPPGETGPAHQARQRPARARASGDAREPARDPFDASIARSRKISRSTRRDHQGQRSLRPARRWPPQARFKVPYQVRCPMRLFARVASLVVFACFIHAAVTVSALAQSWPQRPVRLIVPAGTGTAIDFAARLYAERLGEISEQARRRREPSRWRRDHGRRRLREHQ